MLLKMKVNTVNHGKPIEADIEITVTPSEMIEVYSSAPDIIKAFNAAMREDKRDAKVAKEKRKNKKDTQC